MSTGTGLALVAMPAMVAIATDLGSKAIITANLRECVAPPVRLCDRVNLVDPVGLLFTSNPDAAFGVASGSFTSTIGLAIVIVLLLAQLLVIRGSLIGMVGVSLELGGFTANLIDRAVNGAVTDFIDLRVGLADKGLVVNPADIALVMGALLFLRAVSQLMGGQSAQPRAVMQVRATTSR